MSNFIPRNEYPRPQFERKNNFVCLNGKWDFEIDNGVSGDKRGLTKKDAKLNSSIIVPFCPESELSTVNNKDFMGSVWYKREITIPANMMEKRAILHFGAVDFSARIYINGNYAFGHEGGYTSFEGDITPFIEKGKNTITVWAIDNTTSPVQATGKQSEIYESYGCFYTRTTGIWQTVWLEYVDPCHLKSVKTTADPFTGVVTFDPDICGKVLGLTFEVTIKKDGKQVIKKKFPVGMTGAIYSLTVPSPKPWSPESPDLYDIRYRLLLSEDGKTEVKDDVISYTGFRSIEIDGMTIKLNGKPYFQRLVLDQGFYPDGIYTAPTDEALRNDIILSKAAGFNGARLHQKVFEERFHYHADHLGYITWGEFPSWGVDVSSAHAMGELQREWLEAVDRDYSHPSIIGWCPLNETWDYVDVANDKQKRTQDNIPISLIYRTTKAIDHTRPVIDTSGNFHVETDVYDIHDYEQNPEIVEERYAKVGPGQIYENFGTRQKYNGQPYFISEYGGTAWNSKGGWGYGVGPKDEAEYAERYDRRTRALLNCKFVCAFCYTQLTDVEQEQNGIYDYNRNKKFSDKTYEIIRAANTAEAAIEEE